MRTMRATAAAEGRKAATSRRQPPNDNTEDRKEKIGVGLSGLEHRRESLVAALMVVAFVAITMAIALLTFG